MPKKGETNNPEGINQWTGKAKAAVQSAKSRASSIVHSVGLRVNGKSKMTSRPIGKPVVSQGSGQVTIPYTGPTINVPKGYKGPTVKMEVYKPQSAFGFQKKGTPSGSSLKRVGTVTVPKAVPKADPLIELRNIITSMQNGEVAAQNLVGAEAKAALFNMSNPIKILGTVPRVLTGIAKDVTPGGDTIGTYGFRKSGFQGSVPGPVGGSVTNRAAYVQGYAEYMLHFDRVTSVRPDGRLQISKPRNPDQFEQVRTNNTEARAKVYSPEYKRTLKENRRAYPADPTSRR